MYYKFSFNFSDFTDEHAEFAYKSLLDKKIINEMVQY